MVYPTKRVSLLFLLIAFTALLAAQQPLPQDLLSKEIRVTMLTGDAVTLLKHIEEKENIIFSYSNKVCLPKKVIFHQNRAPLKYFLDQIFASCYVEYKIRDNKVLITPIKTSDLKLTIRGYVRDGITGEVLIRANIYDFYGSKGTISNDYGFYSLSLNGGSASLGCSYVGYSADQKLIELTGDTLINFNLMPMPELEEIPVFASHIPTDVRSTRTGTIDVPLNQIRNIPSFLGEVDLIKSVQLLPGVQSGNEGFSGMYVRGGGPDQNLILLDDIPVYNVEHLLGFFSIFNPDAINKVTVIKGGFPAQYGGRLSSVLDIRMFEGNQEKLKGSASLGLLSSKIALDGPLIKNKTSFSTSFRRTYYDILTAPFENDKDERSNYYFFDLNVKLNHQFSPRNRIFLSNYWGRDDLSSRYNFKQVTQAIITGEEPEFDLALNDEAKTGWGNLVSALRWNYLISDKLFSNLTITFSDYKFATSQEQNYYLTDSWSNISRRYYSGIRDLNAKIDVDYFPANGHQIKFGGSYTFHRFFPGIDVMKTELSTNQKSDTTLGGKAINGNEYHAYIQDEMNLSSTIKVNMGTHFSMYNTGSKNYYSVEPRLSMRILMTPSFSVKAAYSLMTQYIHLLNTANMSLPTDLWLPVSERINPMRAWQTALGGEWEIDRGFSFSAEAYYKELSNLIDYKDSQSFFDFSTSWDNKLTSGDGNSYGLELLLHKKLGAWSGWAGYTYSISTSHFNQINNGKAFRSNNDRRHDASIFLSYIFNSRADASLTWAFGSGKPVTLPSEKYFAPPLPTSSAISSDYSESFSKRNGYLMPNFHRLDVGMNFHKEKSWGKRTWSLGIMNLYGRQNPFFLYFSDNKNPSSGEITRSLKQFSLFPFPLPYIRYTIYF
jgi:hypothetical protein